VISREVGSRLNVGKEEINSILRIDIRASWSNRNRSGLVRLLVAEKKEKAPPADEQQELAAVRPRRGTCCTDSQGSRVSRTSPRRIPDGPTAASGLRSGYFKRATPGQELEDKTFA